MKRLAMLLVAGTSAISMAPALYAQEQSESDQFFSRDSVDAIIVTARRRDEDVQDVPAVVNAVTSEELQKLNLRKLEDVAAVVPGLQLTSNVNGIGSVTTVRGVDFNVNVSGNNGTVEFYLNDSPISAGALYQSLFDVGQIEVQRGPQGTLRGRASPSGSIAFTTRRPDLSEFGGYMDLTFNDIGGTNANAAVNVPVWRDKIAVRVAGLLSDDDGSRVKAVGGGGLPLKNEASSYRGSISADPFDGILTADFMYQKFRRESRQYPQVESFNQVVAGAAASPVTISARDRLGINGLSQDFIQRFDTYSWNAALVLVGQRLTYTGLYLKQNIDGTEPIDKAGLFANPRAGGVEYTQRTHTEASNTSHEIRFQNEDRVAGMFDYVVGYLDYVSKSNSTILRPTGIALLAPTPTLINVVLTPLGRPGITKEKSFFGNLTAHIGDRFEISGGLRRIKYNADSGLLIAGNRIPGFDTLTHKTAMIYTGSAKYQVTDNVMIYAATGSSWRAPATAIISTVTAPTAAQAALLNTDAEKSKSYEVGLKSDLLDRRLRFNLTGFYQKFSNYPYRSPGPGVYTINFANNTVANANYISGVPVKVKGVELELETNFIDNWSIGGNMSYTDGKISNGIIPCTDINGDGTPDTVSTPPSYAALFAATGAVGVSTCATNMRSSSAARLAGALHSEYSMPVFTGAEGFVRGLLSYQGRSKNDPVNAYDDIKPYGILNLYAGLRGESGNWQITFFAKNITNTFRVLQRSNGPIATELTSVPLPSPPFPAGMMSGATSSATNYFGELLVTQPREFGINLRISFGSR